jgi:hypothetical protein
MTKPTSEELVERHQWLPRVDYELMRQEADEFFGTEDRVEPGESEQAGRRGLDDGDGG